MAAPQGLPQLPSIAPGKIKRLIERLSFDTAFRTKFEQSVQAAHGYKSLRTIDPEFPGPFSHYYLSLQYVLHDPRAKALYDQHYEYLSNPQLLEYVCSQLATQSEIMGDLGKGALFDPEDHIQLQQILVQPGTITEQEKKIEETLAKAVKKKEEKKKEESHLPQGGGPKKEAVRPEVKKGQEAPVVTPAAPLLIPPISGPAVKSGEVKPVNPLSFKVRQAAVKTASPLFAVAKTVSHAGFMFYNRHPITARTAIGGAIGGVVSTIMGVPYGAGLGIPAGAFLANVLPNILGAFSQPRPEPEYEEEFEDPDWSEGEYGQGAVRPGGYSVAAGGDEGGYGQGEVRPSSSSFRKSNLPNSIRNMRRVMQTGRNIRTAATAARGLALLANPWVGIPMLVLAIILIIILLFIMLFVILPTNSLLPPGQTDPTAPSSANLSIKKTGPISVEKYSVGEKVTYTITATYSGSGVGSAIVTDTLPAEVSHSKSEPPGEVNGKTVKWTISGLIPQQAKTITLETTVDKSLTDMWLVNNVSGVVSGGSGNAGVGGVCPTPEEIKANRADRNTCKGFNAAIQLLGATVSEQQIQKYIADNAARSGQGAAEFERKTRIIVEKSTQAGINPIIIMGLWKTESGFTNSFGCDPHGGAFPTFEAQVECATGLVPGGAVAIRCAVTKDPNSAPCKLAYDIVNSPSNAHVYYGPYKPDVPPATFDDFMKLYGPLSPNLRDSADGLNNNCIHSYNTLVEFAIDMDACKPTSGGTNADPVVTGALASCKFYRNDQQGRDCPPSDQGFRCEQAVEYKSPLLLSYITAASQKTGVPAEVLAAFVRVESTVPLKYSATKKSYSISDYTDADVQQMKNPIGSNGDIDATIENTNKAMCPRSTTGALGIMQIQPPQQVHDAVIASINANNTKRSVKYDVPAANQPSQSTPGNIDAAARAIGKTKDTLTVDDFCDPQKTLIMAAHVLIGKSGRGTTWTPPQDPTAYETFITELAKSYYGNDGQTGSYGNSVWRSVSSCKPTN